MRELNVSEIEMVNGGLTCIFGVALGYIGESLGVLVDTAMQSFLFTSTDFATSFCEIGTGIGQILGIEVEGIANLYNGVLDLVDETVSTLLA